MAKGCTTNDYEEARKQRLEENKKRFQDLGISRISKNLTEIASSAKKALRTPPRLPKPKSKTVGEVEPRRSSRVRNTVSTYREEVSVDLPSLRKRSRSRPSSWESYVARPLDEVKVATDRERNRALDAAEALQMNLQTAYPSFVKSMVRSHVYSCFWLGLPSKFCEGYLPKTLYDMILEDEDGSEYEAVYIGKRSGLSGGWRAFALDHKLDDGDALVFELIEPARFKIYICRAFPHSVDNEEDTLEEDGAMRATKETKAQKAASNGESESNKTKKRKQAIVHETKESVNQNTLKEEVKTRASKRLKAGRNSESESNKAKQAVMYETKESENSEDHLPESSIENEVKPVTALKMKTRSSQKEMKNISALPVPAESKGEAQIETVKPKAATKLSRKTRNSKEGIAGEIGDSGNTEQLLLENKAVQDTDSELKKVEPVEQASKKPRKKPAMKFFRKKV